MTPLATKDLGVEQSSGLNRRLAIYSFFVDSFNERISIDYLIETLSPTGMVISKTVPEKLIRYNIPAVLDSEGEEVVAANPQFNTLRESQVGQAIIGMLQTDLDVM